MCTYTFIFLTVLDKMSCHFNTCYSLTTSDIYLLTPQISVYFTGNILLTNIVLHIICQLFVGGGTLLHQMLLDVTLNLCSIQGLMPLYYKAMKTNGMPFNVLLELISINNSQRRFAIAQPRPPNIFVWFE